MNLENYNLDELTKKCAEIRRFLVRKVSQTGGHLAPSLGVVELTVALHHVFTTPRDKIIWDVGHQSYAHKILTGRENEFETLRQKGGISGFPKITESEHDAFGTGHASTSISAALGIAAARDLQKEDYQVIAVIGDGALTGGLAFEGLNNLGYLQKDMIVILNDNKMSISLNVGALSEYTKRITKTRHYQDIKNKINNLINQKENNLGLVELKEDLKTLASPGIVFEKMGINYLGPINGHNLEELIKVLKKAKEIKGPKLIHVITTKGKGYKSAEIDAAKFHGIGPFNLATGQAHAKSGLTYTRAFGESLVKLAEKDKKIVAITAAMPAGTGLEKFAQKFSERFFDVGIAEEHAVTFAAGLARQGMKPVVAIYSTFLQRAFDQIIHDVAIQDLPVIFAIDRAGLVGEDGPTHHGVFDLSYLRLIPNFVVSAPKDEEELKNLLYTATSSKKPFAIRYPRGASLNPPENLNKDFSLIPIGQAEILQPGQDIVLLGIGSTVELCEKAARQLEQDYKIKAEVINARFIKPLDKKIIERIIELKKIIVVEENTQIGGLYSAISEELNKLDFLPNIKIKSLALPDKFIEHGPVNILREENNLSIEKIIKAVLKL